MPQTIHSERHFTSGPIVRDIVIGMSDGLTVPFALAAGLSGAVSASAIIITAGLAEVAAGAIAMGLGGYLASRSDAEHFQTELKREQREVIEVPRMEVAEVQHIFRGYGLKDEQIAPIVSAFENSPETWVKFMMRFELGLEEPDPSRAIISAITIASSYVLGGLIPLAPYMLIHETKTALAVSIVVTLIALFVFGFVKGSFTGGGKLRSAIQTLVVGGLAAAAAFFIAKAIS